MVKKAFRQLPVLHGAIVPCSRTNGNGWECNVPSVPGYKRCEYHMWQNERHIASRRADPIRQAASQHCYPDNPDIRGEFLRISAG
mmetsp:Transcript_21526/g.35658  ORF Transcript_21526/g.35658 Transcript_21526/m.35658 type:complete len:85 (+) Transcript_21526:358-612(+)